MPNQVLSPLLVLWLEKSVLIEIAWQRIVKLKLSVTEIRNSTKYVELSVAGEQ